MIETVRKPTNTVERVAAAICRAAAFREEGSHKFKECIMCVNGQCTMWPQFESEAQAAMAEIRRSRK